MKVRRPPPRLLPVRLDSVQGAGGTQAGCTNGCLHNSASATRTQRSHDPSALLRPASRLIHPKCGRGGIFEGRVVFRFRVDCPLLSSLSALPPSPLPPPLLHSSILSSFPCLTVWLYVKAGAFCGSVTNLPGKTETICSGLGRRGDKCVNT